MPRKLAAPTKFDKERQKNDVKLLVFAGYSVRESARLNDVNEDTACAWSVQDGWMEELARIKKLAPSSQANSSTAQNVAFDMAATNKQSRAAYAQIANLSVMRKLKTIAEDESHPGILIEDAQDFGTMVKAQSLLDGSWQDASANRFAVSLQINSMVTDGRIREVPADVTVIES